MALPNSEQTIRASAAMAEAVASMREWTGAASSACLVVGSTGAGKSRLLSSAVASMVDPVEMPPPDGSDCSQLVEVLGSGTGRLVVADDLDKFSKGLREEVVKLAAASGHVLLASMTELASRTRGLLWAKGPDAVVISLTGSASRAEDVRAFIARWIDLHGLTAEGNAVRDCAASCCASGLPRGFRTVEDFLVELAGSGWGSRWIHFEFDWVLIGRMEPLNSVGRPRAVR